MFKDSLWLGWAWKRESLGAGVAQGDLTWAREVEAGRWGRCWTHLGGGTDSSSRIWGVKERERSRRMGS